MRMQVKAAKNGPTSSGMKRQEENASVDAVAHSDPQLAELNAQVIGRNRLLEQALVSMNSNAKKSFPHAGNVVT